MLLATEQLDFLKSPRQAKGGVWRNFVEYFWLVSAVYLLPLQSNPKSMVSCFSYTVNLGPPKECSIHKNHGSRHKANIAEAEWILLEIHFGAIR